MDPKGDNLYNDISILHIDVMIFHELVYNDESWNMIEIDVTGCFMINHRSSGSLCSTTFPTAEWLELQVWHNGIIC